MEPSKQSKVLAAVLVLGAGAIGVDRFVLDSGVSGPRSAAAQQSATDTHESSPAQAQPRPTSAHASLASRLQNAHDADLPEGPAMPGTESAFTPPQGWIAPTPEPAQAPATAQPENPAAGYRLSSVISKPVPIAVINGKTLVAGETSNQLPGVRLIQVDNRSAVIEVNGQRVVLSLDTPDLSH